MTLEINDINKILAREILFQAVDTDSSHCKLAVDNYQSEINLDISLSQRGYERDRIWNEKTCLFQLTNQSPVDRVGWDDGSKIASLTIKVKHNAMYRLTKEILKTNNLSQDVNLVYSLFLNKSESEGLSKLLDKIKNNTMKSKHQKLESMMHKMNAMLDKLEVIFANYQKEKYTKKIIHNNIQKQLINIKKILWSIVEKLYIELNNTPKRIQTRNSIARILCNIIYDSYRPSAYTLTQDSYSEEELREIKTAYNEANEIFNALSVSHRELDDLKLNYNLNLLKKLNSNLILSTMISLKSIFIKNARRQNLCSTSSSPEEKKITLTLVLADGEMQKFIMPIHNLKKLTIYDCMYKYNFKETEQNVITIKAINIGRSYISSDNLVCFFKFIANGDFKELQINNLIELQQILDFFMVSKENQEEIIMHVIINQESKQLLNQSFPFLIHEKEEFSSELSRNLLFNYSLNGNSNLLKETKNIITKLSNIARNNCI